MSPCARGCCWNPWGACSKKRTCSCHWDERRPCGLAGDSQRHKDPTANTAIRNVMKGQRP